MEITSCRSQLGVAISPCETLSVSLNLSEFVVGAVIGFVKYRVHSRQPMQQDSAHGHGWRILGHPSRNRYGKTAMQCPPREHIVQAPSMSVVPVARRRVFPKASGQGRYGYGRAPVWHPLRNGVTRGAYPSWTACGE